MFDAHLVESHPSRASTSAPLRWPPPGIEALQGAAWRALALLAVGTFILTAPLLLAVATPQSFWSAGPFGASWWLPVSAALLGLLVVIVAAVRFVRLLLAGASAVRQGHDWSTVRNVACDRRYDAGFLLQGHRQYATLEERERRMLLGARAVAVTCYTLALLWLCCAFAAGIILASRDFFATIRAFILFVTGPAAALTGVGVLAHGIEANACRALARAWRKDESRERKIVDEIDDWRADRATRLIHLPVATRRVLPARLAVVALVVALSLLPLPVMTLALTSAMGPMLAQVALPRYESSAARFARASLLTPYALPATGTMTALEAGEALHTIVSIGSTAPRSAVEREPVRRFAPWPDVTAPATLPQLQTFGTQLMPRAAGLAPDEVAYLERITAHPALAEFSRIARTPLIDVPGGRWNAQMLAGTSLFELPMIRSGALREATHRHIARAVLEVHRGQHAAAETTLREVISVGLLIGRESPTMIDLLVGNNIAITGAAALQTFYQTVGRAGEAEAMRRQNEGVERAEEFARVLRVAGGYDEGLQRAMIMAGNDELPRGLRWESLLSVQIGAGCLNTHTVVFGHGTEYGEWLERTRSALVRYPSEQALFDLTLRGTTLPESLQSRSRIFERLLSVTLGRGETTGACAALLTGLSTL